MRRLLRFTPYTRSECNSRLLCPKTKLIVSYHVGTREEECCVEFMDDLRRRLTREWWVHLSTDAWAAYPEAIDLVFGPNVIYHPKPKEYGPNSYVERQNLTMRMSMQRFHRKTNGHSKRFEQHCKMVALYFLHYNFCRVHETLRTSPAMAAGVDKVLRGSEWIVGLVEKFEAEMAAALMGRCRYGRRSCNRSWTNIYVCE